ncbi:MAG: prolyl oligopeptidase family serine peptidase [Chloroflexi bacterium]|nr:prolyl oligopeptidase family serine peptidase [Chloroflexota bacterium]
MTTQQSAKFAKTLKKKVQLNYLLHTPPGEGKHPLIVFLHGHGESGSDLEKVKVHGIPRIVEEQPDFPFVTVSPQCPNGVTWVLISDAVEALAEEAMSWENVDSTRVYLTGLSMGGYGTWHSGTNRPDLFAALAPICGGGSFVNYLPFRFERLKNMPVWAFHGDADTAVPLAEQKNLVNALKKQTETEVKFTVYKGVGHDSWTQTYANPKLYKWLLKWHN